MGFVVASNLILTHYTHVPHVRTHTQSTPFQCLLRVNESYLAAAAQDVGQARSGAAGERGRGARGDGGRGADRLGGVAEERFGDHGLGWCACVLTILTCNVVKKGRGEGVGGRAEVGSKWMRGDNNVQHYVHRHIRCTDKPYTTR